MFSVLPGGAGKEPVCQCTKLKKWGFEAWSERYPENQEDPLEEDMATHSSIPAWRIPWMEEPGGLQSIGLHRVGQDWSNLAHTHAYMMYKISDIILIL